jgi:general secretion pathway protein L
VGLPFVELANQLGNVMSRKVLALDIRSDSISAVLVKSSLRESRIAACLTVPIPESAADAASAMKAALETLPETMDLVGADCAVSIPAVHFSSRNLQVPFANAKKIRMVLPFEMEPSLPFQADDLVIDFSMLPSTGAPASETEVLAVAVEKARLSAVVDALAGIGIDPERVTLSGLSTAVWVGRSAAPEDTLLFLDASRTFAALFVVAANRVRLIRSFPLPVDASARQRAVQNHLRTTLGLLGEMEGMPREPGEVIVAGDGLEEMDLEALAGSLPLALRPVNLREILNVLCDEGLSSGWNPGRMDGALALAMAEVEGVECLNFHRSQFPGRKIVSRHRAPLIRTGALAAAVLLLMFASVIIQSYLQQRRLADLDQQIAAVFSATFPEVKKPADPYQQMQIGLQEIKKNAALPGEALPAARSIDILKSISDNIPQDITVVFERMVLGPDSLLISGSTAAFNSVDEIKGHLERVATFKKVTISSANTDRSGKEVNFQLKVDL